MVGPNLHLPYTEKPGHTKYSLEGSLLSDESKSSVQSHIIQVEGSPWTEELVGARAGAMHKVTYLGPFQRGN